MSTETQNALNATDKTVTDRYLILMLGRFIAPYWRQLLGVFGMLILVTLLTLVPPFLVQQAVDGPISNGNLDGLVSLGLLYFLAILAIFGLQFAYTYLLQTVGQSALLHLRQELYEHLLKQDMRFFNKTPVGQIVSRLSSDIEALTELLSTSIVMVVSNLVTLIGLVSVMFLLNWRLALISLAVLPIMTIATAYWRVKIRQQSRELHKVVADYQAFTNEQFNGMLEVQLFGREEISRQEFNVLNTAYKDIHMEMRDYFTLFSSTLQLMTAVGLALVLAGGSMGVAAGWATVGMLIAFIQYTQRSFVPIIALSEQFSQIQTALSAGERIARMLRIEPEIVEVEEPSKIDWDGKSVTFERVSFSYTPDAPVLRAVDLHIEEGQTVALVGATGAGKTTLAKLLARFYDVTDGRVMINGVDVRDLSFADLRQHVMVVPQNPYCFDGTIADNLRLFDHTITEAQMREAAAIASSAPFIELLPDGYDFELLPGGSNLSEGQRQLIALTRALIHSPNSILVLDEATSSIDTETEELIQIGLERVLHHRTSLIIAHRLSTVRNADRILVMKDGVIIEDGNHEQLLALDGYYARLYHSQFDEPHHDATEQETYIVNGAD